MEHLRSVGACRHDMFWKLRVAKTRDVNGQSTDDPWRIQNGVRAFIVNVSLRSYVLLEWGTNDDHVIGPTCHYDVIDRSRRLATHIQ